MYIRTGIKISFFCYFRIVENMKSSFTSKVFVEVRGVFFIRLQVSPEIEVYYQVFFPSLLPRKIKKIFSLSKVCFFSSLLRWYYNSLSIVLETPKKDFVSRQTIVLRTIKFSREVVSFCVVLAPCSNKASFIFMMKKKAKIADEKCKKTLRRF